GGRLRLRPGGEAEPVEAVRDAAARGAGATHTHAGVVRLVQQPDAGAGPAGYPRVRAARAVPDERGGLEQPDRLAGGEQTGAAPGAVPERGGGAAGEVPAVRLGDQGVAGVGAAAAAGAAGARAAGGRGGVGRTTELGGPERASPESTWPDKR